MLASLMACWLAAPAFPQSEQRPSLSAGALGPAHRIDGVLDEPEWASAPAGSDLVMVEPRQGDRPLGRGSVKVLAGPKALVFAIRCDDPEPSGIVSFTKQRDGDFESEDHVVLVLDPFQDGRSGYVFAVNPGAARFDALVQPGGEDVDESWDGEWEAGTVRDAGGWTAEIRIPIQTLSFERELHEWGLNLQRRIQRVQETDRWASPRQDYSVFQSSRAGLLTGLPAFDLGLGLGVRPALVGGFRNPAPDASADGSLEPSLEVTQRLGSNALASLSLNTDFAETEVDTRQTNLARFPLFFPEKRTFFLDAADIFSFGAGLGGESLLPFFSRRIGLVAGQEIPLLAGLKATGRVGDTSFGGLVVRTREEPGLVDASTLAVARVRRNVLKEPFEVVDGVVIPPGAYDWRRYRVEIETAAKRKLSGQATWWFGGFYTGTLHQVELEASWTPSPVVTFLLEVERNLGSLEQGDFDLTLVGTRVRLNLSPDLQLNSFLQYDTEARALGTNTRLRWTFDPRGDLFVIYNHNLRELENRWQRSANELLVKLQYTFRR